MNNFLTRRNPPAATAAPMPAETGRKRSPMRWLPSVRPRARRKRGSFPAAAPSPARRSRILFERMSPAHRFQIARIEPDEAADNEPRTQALRFAASRRNSPTMPANSTGPAASARIAATAPESSIAMAAAKPSAPAGSGRCRTGARPSPVMTAAAPPGRPGPPATSVAALARAAPRLVTRCYYPVLRNRKRAAGSAQRRGCPVASPGKEAKAITMADDRIVVTSTRPLPACPRAMTASRSRKSIRARYCPASLQGAKFYETPQGLILGKPLEGANDQRPSGRCGFRPGRTRSRSATPNSGPGWNGTTRR